MKMSVGSTDLDVLGDGGRFRDCLAGFSHALEVEVDGLPDQVEELFLGLGCSHAARQVGYIGAVVVLSFLDATAYRIKDLLA
jgi:hypothetical protein